MKRFLSAAVAAIALASSAAVHAEGWRFGLGPSYVSGIDDVLDLYEYNMERDGYAEVDVDMLLPVGIAFAADYHTAIGLRFDLGLGPIFFITGDADHFELPLTGTVGYSFLPNSSVSPYVRAGFAYHFVSGDYERGASPGLFAAAGIDFNRMNAVKFTLEVASDQSEVEFDTFSCTNQLFPVCNPAVTEINTYDLTVSLFIKF